MGHIKGPDVTSKPQCYRIEKKLKKHRLRRVLKTGSSGFKIDFATKNLKSEYFSLFLLVNYLQK